MLTHILNCVHSTSTFNVFSYLIVFNCVHVFLFLCCLAVKMISSYGTIEIWTELSLPGSHWFPWVSLHLKWKTNNLQKLETCLRYSNPSQCFLEVCLMHSMTESSEDYFCHLRDDKTQQMKTWTWWGGQCDLDCFLYKISFLLNIRCRSQS